MQTLPGNPNLDHLKKQAKDLLRGYRRGDASAIARFSGNLPALYKRSPDEIREAKLALHDAQSCIAREYGFVSWPELVAFVEARSFAQRDHLSSVQHWLAMVYGGDVTGSFNLARPGLAARLLRDAPEAFAREIPVACAIGDVALLRATISADPQWVHRTTGPFNLPPLVAVTHSGLMSLPEFSELLRQSARLLLSAGADPDQSIGNRFPPASVSAPDEKARLSALYGAAGANRDVAMTELLLDAGADPNDGESLYHSLENPDCTRALLRRGARINGANALGRALDMPDAAALELLLAHGGDANDRIAGAIGEFWGSLLLRAIAVRCSIRHVQALLDAGADPAACTSDGVSAYRLAQQVGRLDVAQALSAAGVTERLSDAEQFVAACSQADALTARRIKASRADLPASLAAIQLRLLPDAVAWGNRAAAMVMVELGWPIDARGGDWEASALNLAVFRGDAQLTDFLLDHGASWHEKHGYGDDVLGTLSWTSINQPVADGDWMGCAHALLRHGLEKGACDPADPERVLVEGRWVRFAEEVASVLGSSASG
jgi:ankyrin repeat protein